MTTATKGLSPWQNELGVVLAEIRDDPAALASCRRGLGKRPMDVPVMWPYVVRVVERARRLDADAWPAHTEAAIHHALALYATHQQSRPTPMHKSSGAETRFGSACRACAIARGPEGRRPDEGVRRRFLAAATADSVDELVGHLRALIPLLREAAIPVDYVRLAADLDRWPYPNSRNYVRRQWGRDFEHTRSTRPNESAN